MTKKIFGLLLPDWVDENTLKKLVYSFLGLVVAVLVSMLFVWPRFTDLYKEEKELLRLERSFESLSESVDKLENFEENLGGDRLASLELAVPKTFDPGLILTSLRQISGGAGVLLETYEVDKGVVRVEVEETGKVEDGPVSLRKHKVKLKLVGNSNNLIAFTDLLGKSLPFSIISDLSLSEISKLFTQQGVSQLEMEVTYYESRLLKVSLDKVAGLSTENKRLLDEIEFRVRPRTTVGETGDQAGGRGSIFGF